MANDDLRLNDLDRFQKRASRLALEIYDYCEVPAGCGGAVLRWRRTGAPIGLSVAQYVGGSVPGFFLDGEPMPEQRKRIPPGAHVIAFVVDAPEPGFLLWKMSLNPKIATARTPEFHSRADGHFRATSVAPPDGWMLPGFDDSSFVDLTARAVPQPSGKKDWTWQFLVEVVEGLGMPDKPPSGWFARLRPNPRFERLWVRCRFHLDDAGFS